MPPLSHLLTRKARQDLQNLSPVSSTLQHGLDCLMLLMYDHLFFCLLLRDVTKDFSGSLLSSNEVHSFATGRAVQIVTLRCLAPVIV